jgi:hypothetical protein
MEPAREAGVMTGYHTSRVRPPEHADGPERIAIREALAFGPANSPMLNMTRPCTLT